MKRHVAVLAGLLVLPAFADVVPEYYTSDSIEYTDDGADVEAGEQISSVPNAATNIPVVPASTAARNINAGRASSSSRMIVANRVAAVENAQNSRRTGTATPSRVITARGATATPTAPASRGTASRVATSRAMPNVVNSDIVDARGAAADRGVAARSATVARAGVTSARVSSRAPTIRVATATANLSTSTTTTAATTPAATATTVADTTASMNAIAEMTDYCKAQYTSCMDNFCNVLDDNQGRCSCSPNLKNYEKTEEALKQATADLQDVAQKIQYIGLSADEVETLFTQTAAELEMQSNIDNSQIKNDLDKIKNMIVDVKRGTASASDSGISVDLSGLLDFNISSTGFDLASLLGSGNNSTSSISNQRGEQLYKTAAARCKSSVLNECASQGVDTAIIVNSYDMEIDKQCIAYERALTDSNDQMLSTVRNAKSVLQKARLLVAQQKNAYDLRGCINALDSCMQDEFVCGTDYENCLDASGRYIVNGEIVVGSTPGAPGCVAKDGACGAKGALYEGWDYTSGSTTENAWVGTGSTVDAYVSATLFTKAKDHTDAPKTISAMLQQKIGYHEDAAGSSNGRDFGMCMSVLNKCQNYTYEKTGQNASYDFSNSVIKEYLRRVVIQIKNKQDTLLKDYAENCISDVTSCLSENNFDASKEGSCTTGSSTGSAITCTANKLAVRACYPLINTCMSVNGIVGNASTASMAADEWILSVMGKD